MRRRPPVRFHFVAHEGNLFVLAVERERIGWREGLQVAAVVAMLLCSAFAGFVGGSHLALRVQPPSSGPNIPGGLAL